MRRVCLVLVGVALITVPRAGWTQAGVPLGPEFRANTFTTNDQRNPAIARDPSGNFVVVWNSPQDGSAEGVFGQRYSGSGAPLGGEFRVNTFTTNPQGYQSVAADGVGNFVVVWTSYQDGSSYGAFGQRYASSGAPLGTEFRVNTYTTAAQGYPSVAAASSGAFVVVWVSNTQDGSNFGVFGQRYAASGAPLGSEFRVNTFTTSYQFAPAVASDASGNFVVVWQSYGQDGSDWGVFGQRYASTGAPLGTEFRINTFTTNIQGDPAVSSDPAGNFVVVWSSTLQDGSQDGVFGQRYASSGAPLGGEFRVNTYTTNGESYPAVASDASGNFVVSWASNTQDGSNSGVFGQRYAASGIPAGSEFRVNTFTTSDQDQPAVASDPLGNFVVVWTSNTQDGSLDGVFGQRYGPIVPVELIHFAVD
jgi:hypothetical protein